MFKVEEDAEDACVGRRAAEALRGLQTLSLRLGRERTSRQLLAVAVELAAASMHMLGCREYLSMPSSLGQTVQPMQSPCALLTAAQPPAVSTRASWS